MVERQLSILADLNEIAVGISHAKTPFSAVIGQRLREEGRSFVAPCFVAGPDVDDAQVKEAIHSVEIRRAFLGAHFSHRGARNAVPSADHYAP